MLLMPIFLEKKYSLEQVLLQSEEELLARRSSDIVSEGVAPKPKKIIGKMKVQSIVMYFLFFIFHFLFLCIFIMLALSLYVKTSITCLKF